MLEKNDHRQLGHRLDLFHLQEEAPGMVFWHPRGFLLYRKLEEAIRRQLRRDGFLEVRSPQVLRQSIWEQSGHWESFSQGMFRLDDEEPAALKPVSCPGHIQIVRRRVLSYRDLPLRLAEFGLVHRNEQRGSLHGLFRLRQFSQDDGHIFCREDQIEDEMARFCEGLARFYAAFDFSEVRVAFSNRPSHRFGEDVLWDRAESALAAAAKKAGLEPSLQEGQGAFYGPKLEFILRDRSNREWQCGTLQLDFVLPGRFGLEYVEAGGGKRSPVMLHRAIFGSIERFLGILLEHHAGVLPAWLAPEPVRILAVGEAVEAGARALHDMAERAGLCAGIDVRAESLSRKILDAHAEGVPFLLLFGEREKERGLLTVRAREGQRSGSRDEILSYLLEACRPPL